MKNTVLTNDQNEANDAFLQFLVDGEDYLVIHGSAGTGKSFLVKHLINTYISKYSAYCLLLDEPVKEINIFVTATTNKAVTVLQEFLSDTQSAKISTIYQLLGLKIVNDYKTGETRLEETKKSKQVDVAMPYVYDDEMGLIFIDESSFINEELFEMIKLKLTSRPNIKVIFIGDQYQLAPVGQDFSVFEEMTCKKCALDEVMRNAGHILHTGLQFKDTVHNGVFTPINFNGIDVVHVDGPSFQQEIETAFKDPYWTPDKAKILAWTNNRVQEYNKHVRSTLNLGENFEIGEMVVTNNFISSYTYGASVDSKVEITNIVPNVVEHGIFGARITIDGEYTEFLPYDHTMVKALLKEFAADKNWKEYFRVKDTWFDLRAIYASSIHKSQGSTYETVFIDLTDIGRNWQPNDVARLLYVAITRASKRVVCYGELPAYYRGV